MKSAVLWIQVLYIAFGSGNFPQFVSSSKLFSHFYIMNFWKKLLKTPVPVCFFLKYLFMKNGTSLQNVYNNGTWRIFWIQIFKLYHRSTTLLVKGMDPIEIGIRIRNTWNSVFSCLFLIYFGPLFNISRSEHQKLHIGAGTILILQTIFKVFFSLLSGCACSKENSLDPACDPISGQCR